MKAFTLFRQALLGLLLFINAGSVLADTGAGTISTAQVGTFPALTTGSFVSVDASAFQGGATIQIVMQSASLTSAPQLWYTPDKGVTFLQVSDYILWSVQNNLTGPISRNTVGSYWANIPPGKYYILEPAGGGGTANVFAQTGPQGLGVGFPLISSILPAIPVGATPEIAASASPITTAATVQIFAAVGSKTHYVWFHYVNDSATTTEVQILDGATVIDDFTAYANGGGLSYAAPMPEFGTSGNAISIKVLTAGASIRWTAVGYNK